MEEYLEEYNKWLNNPIFDEETKRELLEIKDDKKEIEDRFYKELEFGTAGLRGILGAGTNRMNLYFDGIPEPEVRDLLKKNGFKWAGSYYKCWTRLLNANAEKSLDKIKQVLKI